MFWHSLYLFYGYFTTQFNTCKIHRSIFPNELFVINVSTSLVEFASNN